MTEELLPSLPTMDGMTTATIDTNYPLIGPWEEGQQVVMDDPSSKPYIYSRRYSFPLPITEPLSVREVLLPYEDPPDFYRLEVPFKVEEFASYGDFYRWEREIQEYKLEILNYNRPSSTLQWVRPSTMMTIPRITMPLRGATQIDMGIEPTSYTHPRVTLTLNTGFALGLELRLGKVPSLKGASSLTSTGSIQATYNGKPFSGKVNLYSSGEVQVTTDAYAIEAVLYGEERYSVTPFPHRLMNDAEDEILMHPPGTPTDRRLFPPGRPNLRDDFWNNPNREKTIVTGYASRPQKGWK